MGVRLRNRGHPRNVAASCFDMGALAFLFVWTMMLGTTLSGVQAFSTTTTSSSSGNRARGVPLVLPTRTPDAGDSSETALSVAASFWPRRESPTTPSSSSFHFGNFPKWDAYAYQAVAGDLMTEGTSSHLNHKVAMDTNMDGDIPCDCSEAAVDIHLVDLPWLKPHEEVVSEQRVVDLLKATEKWGAYVSPLLVDKVTGAILDGHHRYHVGVRLGLKRVPAVLVDYAGDPSITVDVWEGCGLDCLTKHQVLAMAKSPHVFPPKTSRHSFSDALPNISVPLSTLKGSFAFP